MGSFAKVSAFSALVLAAILCQVDRVDAVNTAPGAVSADNYPYMVRVKKTSSSDVSPGVMISRKYVLTNGFVITGTAVEVFRSGVNYTPAKAVTDPNGVVTILKVCWGLGFPYMTMTQSAHFDFQSNRTGDVLLYHNNGTLIKYSADILPVSNCAALYPAGSTIPFNSTHHACLAFQASACGFFRSAPVTHFPAVIVNGIVVAFMVESKCDFTTTNLFTGPQLLARIQPKYSWIAANADISIP